MLSAMVLALKLFVATSDDCSGPDRIYAPDPATVELRAKLAACDTGADISLDDIPAPCEQF